MRQGPRKRIPPSHSDGNIRSCSESRRSRAKREACERAERHCARSPMHLVSATARSASGLERSRVAYLLIAKLSFPVPRRRRCPRDRCVVAVAATTRCPRARSTAIATVGRRGAGSAFESTSGIAATCIGGSRPKRGAVARRRVCGSSPSTSGPVHVRTAGRGTPMCSSSIISSTRSAMYRRWQPQECLSPFCGERSPSARSFARTAIVDGRVVARAGVGLTSPGGRHRDRNSGTPRATWPLPTTNSSCRVASTAVRMTCACWTSITWDRRTEASCGWRQVE